MAATTGGLTTDRRTGVQRYRVCVSLMIAYHHRPVFLDLLVEVDDRRSDVGVVAWTNTNAKSQR
jgi:hypothetical protein